MAMAIAIAMAIACHVAISRDPGGEEGEEEPIVGTKNASTTGKPFQARITQR